MSYIDNDLKVCYIHIAKNGGRSISEYLAAVCGRPGTFADDSCPGWWFQGAGHATYFKAEKFYGKNNNWFAFAHIRNPIDRVYSAWKGYEMHGHVITFKNFIEYINNLKKSSPLWEQGKWRHNPHDIRDMPEIYADPIAVHAHVAPQSFYFSKDHNINLYDFNDLYGFVRDLPKRYQGHVDLIKNSGLKLPHTHDGKYKKPKHDASIIKKIESIYEQDFELYESIKDKS
jgi:hypothetical protein